MWVQGGEKPLEEGMVTHSSIFTWRIPWTEEPGGLQSIGSQRVGHEINISFVLKIGPAFCRMDRSNCSERILDRNS